MTSRTETTAKVDPRAVKALIRAALTCFAVGGAIVAVERLWPSRVLNEIGYSFIGAPLLALARGKLGGGGSVDYRGPASELLKSVLLVNFIFAPAVVTALVAGVGSLGKGESWGTSVPIGLAVAAFVAACMTAFDLIAWLFGRFQASAPAAAPE